MSPRRVRVLVVDDSLSVRAALERGLSEEPRVDVIGLASDGREALEELTRLKPDVVTLDIQMPGPDGIETLRQIMVTRPTPVVMVSSLAREGARATVEALQLGAVDFVLKPAARGASAARPLIPELIEKILAASKAHVPTPTAAPAVPAPAPRGPSRVEIVVIASSTGGPQALRHLLSALPAELSAPIVVVQHLPAAFTAALAQSLDGLCPLPVGEANAAERLRPGRVFIAPGGVHLIIERGQTVRLDLSEAENGVRPSANVTMASAAEVYGAGTVGVVLTGMGSDGTRGAAAIKQAGGTVIAEAASTCVIYGMPKSVVEAGYADQILPLSSIGGAIAGACERVAA